jgi:hypothetical protein
MQLVDRENEVPVFSPDNVASFDLEFFEMTWILVFVVLRMGVVCQERAEIDNLLVRSEKLIRILYSVRCSA